jgi:virulence-associated protein VagC
MKVTEQGVLVPRELLRGADEVEIREEDGVVVIAPVETADPIFEFGKDPVKIGVDDASVNLDHYLYGRP